MRPRSTAATDRPRTGGDRPSRKSGLAAHHGSAGGKPPRGLRAPPWKTMTSCGLVMALATLALASPAESASVRWPSKRQAHSVAVRVTAAACRGVAWCQSSYVVPASRCRRDSDGRTVYCAIAFITARHQRCGGVVGVSKTRDGRLESVMAVPQDCSTDSEPETTPA
jgi:hypothetical protein